tara:strand:+ start:550 stop:837 length:288 start_codon:yes stop_codon:yes gene_type:complete
MLVYLVSVLRARGLSFVVLVYNVAAKHELLSRGLLPSEVYNTHSYLFRQYSHVIKATLTEHRIMMQVGRIAVGLVFLEERICVSLAPSACTCSTQ